MQELLGSRVREVAVDKHGIPQHLRNISHRRGWSSIRDRLHPGHHHRIAKWAAHSNLRRARRNRLGGPILINARAQILLHEHARPTRTATKTLVTIPRHLHQISPRGPQQFAGRIEHLIVPTQETRIMVRDRLPVLRTPGNRCEQLIPNQPVE